MPVGGDQPVEDAPESTEPTATSRVPITTARTPESEGSVQGWYKLKTLTDDKVNAGMHWRDALDQARVEMGWDDAPLTPSLRQDDLRLHPEAAVEPEKIESPKEASWLLEGTNISATPAPWETPLPDLTGGPLEQEEDPAAWLVSDLPKTAGAKFNPMQQREFIDEDGEARNLDRLDIEGTHYKVREANSVVIAGKGVRHAQPDMAPDDHLVFGL